MWKKCIIALILMAAVTGLPAWSDHHEAEPKAEKPPVTFFVWTDHVDTNARDAYRAAAKEAVDKLRAVPEGEKLRATVLETPEGYLWAMPMKGMDLSRLSQAWDPAIKAAGGPEIWKGTSAASTHGSAELFVLREDLSYLAAEPREAEKDAPARWYDFWYVEPGMREDIEEQARKLKALYAEKKVDSSWRVYQAVTGPDLPLYVVAFPVTSRADHLANGPRIGEMVGEEGQKILAEARKCARRVDETWGWIVDDLSLLEIGVDVD